MKLKPSWTLVAGALLLAACGQAPSAPTSTLAPGSAYASLEQAPGMYTVVVDGDLAEPGSGAGTASPQTTGSPVALLVGQTRQLNITVNGRAAYPGELTWTSSSWAVATVSTSGLVKAVSGGTSRVRVALTAYPSAYKDFSVAVTGTTTAPAPAPTPAPAPSPAPAPAPTTGSSTFEQQVLTLTNKARAQGRMCGTTYHGAVAPLAYNSQLREAAYGHSRDMALNNYFSHYGKDGRSPFDRMRAAGYAYRSAGENIAAGQTTPDTVVNAWLASPGHCRNIMNGSFKELGVGYYAGGSYRHYWTQNLGSRY